MKEIPLTNRLVALVDDWNYPALAVYRWSASKDRKSGLWYAARAERIDGKPTTIAMHREVMGLKRGDWREVDHICTADTLNNQESNLRIATRQQQNCNRRMRKDNTSGFKGVSLDKRRAGGKTPWQVQIMVDGRAIKVGYAATPQAGSEMYWEAARRLHGEFARLA